MREKLDELARLHAAATKGELQVRGFRLSHTANRRIDYDVHHLDEIGQIGTGPYQAIPFARKEDAEWHAAIHNAFPGLLARLEAAERERDTAKAEVARQWVTLTEIAELVEDHADCDDSEEGIANRPNLAMQVQMLADKATQCNPQAYAWLAARDAQQRREGAAEWLEKAAREGGYYERSSEGMLEEAKQLREGKQMGRIEDLGLVADKGLEWKAKYEAAKEELLKCVQWQHELRQQRAVVANQNRIHLTYLLECHRKGGITPLFLALEEYVQKLQGETK